MNAPIRTRTRRAPAVQPVSKPSLTIDILDQQVCTHRTDFDELERRLYLSSDPAHWQQAKLIEETRQATEQRVEDAQYEAHGDVEERNAERLALRALVRKLHEQMLKPLEFTITFDGECSGNNTIERKDQAEFDELLEEVTDLISEHSVDKLEAEEKPKKPEKKNG